MPGYIQIEGDPTKWWFTQPFQAGQLTGQPLTVQVSAPVVGTLVSIGRPGSVAVFNLPSGSAPNDLDVPIPAIYVPTTSGISEGHVGYELPASANLDTLSSRVAGAMRMRPHPDHRSRRQRIRRDAGAQRRYVVLRRPLPAKPAGGRWARAARQLVGC